MSCQSSSRAPKTASAFATAMRRLRMSAFQRLAERMSDLRNQVLELARFVQLGGARKREIDAKFGVDAPRIRLQHDDARGKKHRLGHGMGDEYRRPTLFSAKAQ